MLPSRLDGFVGGIIFSFIFSESADMFLLTRIKVKLKINIGCAPLLCSIGVKSGLYGGHASVAMLLFARKSWQTRATCGRALSGIVLLQNQITLLHKRDCNRTQDLIPIPYRLDLTPVEHMWDELDRRVRKDRNPPATLAQLRNALIDEWNNIPMRTVNALVNSIQRRIRAATAARGGHTRYWFSVLFWFQDLGGSYQWTSITRDLLITNQWNLELLFHTCTVL